MSVTHSAQAKASIGNAIKDDIDGDASAGALKLMTASSAIKATLPLAYPCGTVNGTTGVLTFDASATTPLEDTSTSSGTVTKATITDNSGDIILNCSVGTTGQDINLSNNVFGNGDTVQITSLTYTPAS